MKKCSDIEQWLPLYAEGVLSEKEKRAVEEHLATCERCRKEMAYLQKSDDLIKQLPRVEQPPWFAQKIMARVRREADRKKTVKRWFYPLRIKIPVQIAATIVIAVLAVYIYRTGDDRVKAVLPGAPKASVEMIAKQPVPPAPEAVKKVLPPPVTRSKKAVSQAAKRDETLEKTGVVGKNTHQAEAPESPLKAAEKADAVGAKGLTDDWGDVNQEGQAQRDKGYLAPARMADAESKVRGQVLPRMAEKEESYESVRLAPPQRDAAEKSLAVSPEANVLIRVADAVYAVSEVEKILIRHNAENMTRQTIEGKSILKARVSAGAWKDILDGLKAIGTVEEKERFAEISGVIPVTIEISVR